MTLMGKIFRLTRFKAFIARQNTNYFVASTNCRFRAGRWIPAAAAKRAMFGYFTSKSVVTFIDKPQYSDISYRYLFAAGILSFLGIKDEKDSEEDPLIETIKRAILSITKEEFDLAEQILHVALKMAQETRNSQGITYVYDLLANVAFSTRDWKKAEILFIETMKRMISEGAKENDDSIVEMSLKLAQIYSNMDMHEKSTSGFKFCIKIMTEKLNSADSLSNSDEEIANSTALLGMVQSAYALYLMDRRQYTDALDHYKNALQLSVSLYGEENFQTLVLFNDVGTVFSLLKEYEKAADYIGRAVDLGQKINSRDLPAFLCNLAAVELKRGNDDAALKCCEMAVKTAKELKDNDALNEAKLSLEDVKKVNL
ncbi:TTC19 (predicted) [Pycnogonum litorale]